MDPAVMSNVNTCASTVGGCSTNALSTQPTSYYNTRYDSNIPDIPSSLMIPPLVSSGVNTTASSLNYGQTKGIPITTTSTSQSRRNPEITELHQDLGNMHSQVVREADVLQNLHHKLSIKAHEMDRLRAEINQVEKADNSLHDSSNLPISGLRVSATVQGGSVMPTTHPSSNDAIVEEFRTRLKMTTELCSKQDAYYRDIIKELEDRLHETIQGRDHILALRDKEAANQVILMRQLENALRQQQQLTTAKSENIVALEEKHSHLQESHSGMLSVLDKIRHVLVDHERTRGRHGISENYQLHNKEFISQVGDTLLQTLQKCLMEDSSERELLNTKLEKALYDLKESEKERKHKLEEMTTDYQSKLDSLKKDHKEAMDSASSQSTKTNEKIQNLEQQLELVNKQHAVEVSGLEDKAKTLQKELDRVNKEKSEIFSDFEKKSNDFDRTNHSTTVELKLLREEKEKLLSSLSQEQANNITLKSQLNTNEHELKSTKQRLVLITEEKHENEKNLNKEIEKYRLEAEKYKTMLLDKERELCLENEREVQRAIHDQQTKADERINIVLFELKKVNTETSNLKNNFDVMEEELNELKVANKVLKENLQKTERDVAFEKEEKLKIDSKFENQVKEADRLQKELDSKIKDLDDKIREYDAASILVEKTKTQLEEREKAITSFREKDTYFAEILQRNNQSGDSLQREREELVKQLQEQVADVQEMKKHREILAKKLKAKDKRLKEVEEENGNIQKSLNAKSEELAALMDDRNEVMSELKVRQLEVGKLREARDSLSNLLDGKDGEREKEIGKLISRLKGSEQDLCLTKKLLKSKGDVSGKAVRVAETMQREVTEKRGEMDALLSKIHWLQENLNAAVKDKMYFESKSSKMSGQLQEVVVRCDKMKFDFREKIEECEAYQKQVSHLEQALEKAALKYADSHSVIEKLEQDFARLKLKHSLELKDLERNRKSGTSLKVDSQTIAEVLARVSALNLRLPFVSSQGGYANTSLTQKTSIMAQPITLQNVKPLPQGTQNIMPSNQDSKNDDLKSLLLDVRTLISTYQSHVTQLSTPAKHAGSSHQNDDRDVQFLDPNKEVPLDNVMQQFDDSDISLDMEPGYHGNFRPPLRSSSPKPEKEISIAFSREPSLSNSDVTSLLSFSTARSLDSNDKSDSCQSLATRDFEKPSSKTIKRPLSDKHDVGNRTSRSKMNKKKTSKEKTSRSRSSPSYERAEEMLRSLAQTGSRLTRKNKEIARLLSEQDTRIKKCRDNEEGIQYLLH